MTTSHSHPPELATTCNNQPPLSPRPDYKMHEHQDTKHVTINLLITKLQNNIHNNQPPTHQENKLSSLLRWQGKYYPSSTTWSIYHLQSNMNNWNRSCAHSQKQCQPTTADRHIIHQQLIIGTICTTLGDGARRMDSVLPSDTLRMIHEAGDAFDCCDRLCNCSNYTIRDG